MIRGTTPKLEFELPFDTLLIAKMYVTISQNNRVVIEKTIADCNCQGSAVTLALTQEDTLKFQQNSRETAEIQIRIRTKDGNALASNIIRVFVGRILKEGVI